MMRACGEELKVYLYRAPIDMRKGRNGLAYHRNGPPRHPAARSASPQRSSAPPHRYVPLTAFVNPYRARKGSGSILRHGGLTHGLVG
jgi:hypothetical protein